MLVWLSFRVVSLHKWCVVLNLQSFLFITIDYFYICQNLKQTWAIIFEFFYLKCFFLSTVYQQCSIIYTFLLVHYSQIKIYSPFLPRQSLPCLLDTCLNTDRVHSFLKVKSSVCFFIHLKMSRLISVVGDSNVRRNMTSLNIASREAMKNGEVIDCSDMTSLDSALTLLI